MHVASHLQSKAHTEAFPPVPARLAATLLSVLRNASISRKLDIIFGEVSRGSFIED